VIAEPSEDNKQAILTRLDSLKGRGPELARFALDPNEKYWWIEVSPDGSRIAATRTPSGPIYVLSPQGQPIQQIQVKGWSNVQAFSWTADGKGLFVVAGIRGGRVVLRMDLQGNANVVWENTGGSGETLAVPSPDGRHLAMQGWTTTGNMWMLENL